MAVSSSIFLTPDSTYTNDSDSPLVSFDAVTSFSPVRSRNISNSPLSDGSYISEILNENAGKISLEAYVANNPVILKQNNLVDISSDSDTRAKAAYAVLTSFFESTGTLRVTHKFDTLENYLLTSFEPIIMPSDTIGFRLTLEEVRFATESRVAITENMSKEKTKEASTVTSTGTTSKTEVESTDTQYSVIKSLLAEYWG